MGFVLKTSVKTEWAGLTALIHLPRLLAEAASNAREVRSSGTLRGSPVNVLDQARIVQNKKVVKDSGLDVNAYAVEYVFTPDAFYDRLAAQLIVTASGKRSQQQGHWLCLRLKDSIDGVNPANCSREVEKPTIALLTSLGFHPSVAQGLGASAALGVRVALTRTPLGDIVTALRVLIALVCPNLAVCPTRSEPFKAFALTTVSDGLQRVEQASAAQRPSS